MQTALADSILTETLHEPAATVTTPLQDMPAPVQAHLNLLRRRLVRSFQFLALSVGFVGLGLLAAYSAGSLLMVGVGLLLAGCSALCGLVASAPVLIRARSFAELWPAALAAGGNLFMTVVGLLPGLSLLGPSGFSRGRQLRKHGRVLLPPVEATSRWCDLSVDVATALPDSDRVALAAQWRENGRTEHASVAAFARLTLDLMAVAAPAALIAASNQDSLDEIRHTELCFSLARKLDGEALGPGAFPAPARVRALPQVRTLALAQLAVDSLIDGALHEGLSARVVAKLAKRCQDPAITAMLREIAADEGRHAAHGWQVVQWCLAEEPTAVAMALSGALLTVPENVRSSISPTAALGAWERFGIPGRDLENTEYAAMRADIIGRVEAIHNQLYFGQLAA